LATSFTYDDDGNRVKSVTGSETTVFIGGYYEVTGPTVTKYYFAGATRVAMRKYTIPTAMAVEYGTWATTWGPRALPPRALV
jgi:hypothetical protein